MRRLRALCLAGALLAAALLPPRRAPAAAFESGLGFSDVEPDAGEAQAYAGKDLEEQLRAVSSVDELMSVLYPEYWKMYKCQLRKGGWQQNPGQPGADPRTEDTVKFAAAHYNAEILKSIDNEWRKTQCMPREVCVDVGKEFGAATNTFFKPPCVSVYRCGGCCTQSSAFTARCEGGSVLHPGAGARSCWEPCSRRAEARVELGLCVARPGGREVRLCDKNSGQRCRGQLSPPVAAGGGDNVK